MEFSIGDIISIVIFLSGIIGIFIKMKIDQAKMEAKIEMNNILLNKDIEMIKNDYNERDVRFEKILGKLENAIEDLNKSQKELAIAIVELKSELKK